MSRILAEVRGQVFVITFNHDEKRNALSGELVDGVVNALEDMKARRVRACVLRAKPGARVWSAGHDVSEMPRSGRDPLAYYDPLERIIRAIRDFPAPVIALIEGSVWGGACELALCCDIRIGTDNATFALTPAKLGVPYNPEGILRIMTALPFPLVSEMFFVAQPIAAQRALSGGILNHLVAPQEIEAFAYGMAERIAEYSPLAIAVIKEQLITLANAQSLSPETFEHIQGLRRRVYDSHDYQEGIAAFLEKRKPHFTGE